jgi:hypothetical protein
MHTSRTFPLCAIAMVFATALVFGGKAFDRDGSTMDKAIMLTESGINKCVDAEYAYIHSHYPDATLSGFEHGTVVEGSRWYDVFRFSTTRGKKSRIIFR